MGRRIIGDGRVLLLTLLLSGSAVAVLPRPVPKPSTTRAAINRAPASPGQAAGTVPGDEPVAESAAAAMAPPDASVGDVQQLAAELMIPVEGVFATDLRDNFSEMRGKRRHEALDILAPRNTPVVAAAEGRVVQLSSNGAGGRMVFAADSTERFLFLYAHLEDYADGLKEGMPLRRGQLLGYVGTSGNAPRNAPHLHFAIKRAGAGLRWSRGTAIDPRALFLPQRVPESSLPEHPLPETQPPAP